LGKFNKIRDKFRQNQGEIWAKVIRFRQNQNLAFPKNIQSPTGWSSFLSHPVRMCFSLTVLC